MVSIFDIVIVPGGSNIKIQAVFKGEWFILLIQVVNLVFSNMSLIFHKGKPKEI